mmetsp:Transcript_28753/g.38338  ORF Transcript_28753/g.38338 Transcript_28753/m.38338 type:complete len:82 (+) Transcript_28753:240-485(+)
MPSKEEAAKLREVVKAPVLHLFEKNQDFGGLDMCAILQSNSRACYDRQDLRDAADLIKLCLKWVPKERLKAKEALAHAFFQ